MDKREAQKQRDLLAVEKQSVKVLKNTFADIKEVKVEELKKNPVTGSYGALVTMTNNEGKSVYFDYFFSKQMNEIQNEGVTTPKIRVIYSNGEAEEVWQ